MKPRKTGLQLLEEIEQANDDQTRWRTLVSTLEEWQFPNVATEDQVERSTVELRTDLREIESRLQLDLRETEARLQQEMAQIRADLRETEARLQQEMAQIKADLLETEARLQKEIAAVRLEIRETEVRLQKSIHRQTFILVGLIGLLLTLFKFAAGGLPF